MRRVRSAETTGKNGVTGRGLKHVWARHEIDEVPERMPRSWRVARKRRNCQRDGETARETERLPERWSIGEVVVYQKPPPSGVR